MDGKSILAVVLCVIVIFVSMFIQTTFFSTDSATTSEGLLEQTTALVEESTNKSVITALADNNSPDTFSFETDIFEITFDPVGASIKSMVMKDHANADGQHVDLVFKGESDHNAFLMYWGDDLTTPILDTFAYTIDGSKIIFTHDYENEKGNVFTVKKTFEFKDSEYLFAVSVDIIGDSSFTGISEGNYAYTIAYEPQVGPSFTQMKNNNYDYRRVYTNEYKDNGKTKKRTASLTSGSYETTSNLKWISLTSKYFTVIAAPESNVAYKYTAKQSTDGDIAQTNGIYLSRPATDASSSETIYFYCGPQLKKYLGSYYSGTDNAWGLRNLNLDDAMESGSWLGWLETILKWMLSILYKIIPNYGVGIILLTIILKLLLWPLSKKSTESTAKMAALNPQLEELRVKYKDNPQKLNQETADLYKQEGINPMGGCLPMLIQFPILIAFYGLLNKHFELRGAMFIPGWISDLSVPETIFTLGFNLPFLGSEIHLLPIIYTVSMILSMKMSNGQTKNSAQSGSMAFMTYGMPILFFFILYSAPSGLLLYWTISNLLSIGQQVYVNKVVKKRPPKETKKEVKVPEAVKKYQEKLKKIEEDKAKAEKEASKNSKKNNKQGN